MNLLTKILAKFIPTNDMKILELKRQIKDLKVESSKLREQLLINDKKVSIRFYDENIEDIIIENIRQAKIEVCVAMAYFTSNVLMDELKKAKSKGVNIKVIISKEDVNSKFKLLGVCNILKVAEVYSRYPNTMHNKYCIIDKKKIIDGSYNWTKRARYNLEHIIIIEDKDVADLYQENFNKIFNNKKYYDNYTISENIS